MKDLSRLIVFRSMNVALTVFYMGWVMIKAIFLIMGEL
jgi:hypothetical protein